ncbi:hypothetical protein [Pseudoalteromonas luteoviolacea]|uniref:Uncharacterized protein n=1 Tax=Pseudoalteromonas luteoviolacea H33 TaxID=1365251 RepID=A0A167F6F5_9GAMM|nr:hypothetical protein [Pseudoalteromonas luteoviolacea]KZN51748.1 hypothetical protein N476_11945 [Pseudoalteromonas luteoviolacea H33]KZN72753.1 hypothetical protein N477_24485 [Pseudoalteromonas luteoviolacea H33-S]
MNMIKYITPFALTFFSAHALSSSQITSLNVDGNNIRFSIGSEKIHQLPSCVAQTTKSLYSFSLSTESGRAMYSLLITAIAGKLPVSVKSAMDCMIEADIERAKSISLAIAPTAPDSYKGISMLYKGDGVTQIGRVIGLRYINSGPVWDLAPSAESNHFRQFRPNDVSLRDLHFTSQDCSGQPLVQYYSGLQFVYNRSYKDSELHYVDRNSWKTLQVNSTLKHTGLCESTTLDAAFVEINPQPHGQCGTKPCILKEI